MHPILEDLKNAKSIILSTHQQPDGDGLGSQVAFYYALKKMGKNVRIINVDAAPPKYEFLNSHDIIETLDRMKSPIVPADLALVFDTNDPTLLGELWPSLKGKCARVVFVDHHPIVERHPLNVADHIIDTNASSTGQIVFDLIRKLHVVLDSQIAMPLYTSIVFDTNYFRYIRGSPTPHLIAAELLQHNIDPQRVHRQLFGNHSPKKLKFLGQMLGHVEYELDGRLACVRVKKDYIDQLGLDIDETRDIIDMVMNVETIEAAALFREDAKDYFKLSFRSKGLYDVHHLAQSLGGGGHKFASGAYIHSPYEEIKSKVLAAFSKLFKESDQKAVSG